MKVWMRPRRAGLIASAARSMSLRPARESPHTTAFLVRLAISCTAAKSPSEAIGKPASMMSTPISSSSSATASFSSCVMVAPGDCSPSRNVVSKMTTRSWSEPGVLMGNGPSLERVRRSGRSWGSAQDPLSAQARAPNRPSGADKEKQTAENEGSAGHGRNGRPSDRLMLAHRHALCPRVDRRVARNG